MSSRRPFRAGPYTRTLILILVALAVTASGCRSKSVVKRLGKVDSKSETTSINGSLYHLPMTVIRVVVPVTAVKYTPGVYGDLAPCFFEDREEADGRIKTSQTIITLGTPQFGSYGKADLDETFVVKTTGGFFESRTIAMKYGKDGVLTDGSVESVDETLPTVLKIAEVVAGVGVKVAARSSPGSMAFSTASSATDPVSSRTAFESRVSCYIRGFDYTLKKSRGSLGALNTQLANAMAEGAPPDVLDVIRTKISSATRETSLAEKRLATAVRLIGELSGMTEEERNFHPFVVTLAKANQAYSELEDLQTRRNALQSGSANLSHEIYSSRLAEIDEDIRILIERFFGKQQVLRWDAGFEYNPSKTSYSEVSTLFVYAPTGGICYNGPYKIPLVERGVVVPTVFQFDACPVSGGDLLKVELWTQRRAEDAGFIATVERAKRDRGDKATGWYFRIPAKAQVGVTACPARDARRCTLTDTEYGRAEMIIAQYGAVVSMPAQTAGRSSATSVSLDDTTGALKNFRMGSGPAIDKATVTEAGKAMQGTLDATDPLTQKKRELELLKVENDINDQRKKLGIPSPTPQ